MKIVKTITINGLTCAACEKLIQKRIAAVSGVKMVQTTATSGKTIIVSDRKIALSEIKNALKGTAYQIAP